jgi:hypothetical protein
MPRTAIPVAALAALALLLAGCGSSAPTPHFAAIADTICANADGEIGALPAARGSLRSLARAARRELPIVRVELTQLAALTAPAGEKTQFASALSSTRVEVALVAKLIAAVRAHEPSRIATLALHASAVDSRAKTAMTSLGLTACAREAAPRGRRRRR